MPKITAIVLVWFAGCGATPAPAGRIPPPPNSTSASAVSLERVERIARGCHPIVAWAQIYPTATVEADAWTSQARVTQDSSGAIVELAIDPIASTCNGAAVDTVPESGDMSLDKIIAIARRCYTAADHARVSVTYVRAGSQTDLDRTKFEVVIAPGGADRVFPARSFVVDPRAETCQPADGPQM